MRLVASTFTLLTGQGSVAAPAAATAPLPEILVTARRLPEPLATLPLSVTVFGADRIQQQHATTVDDLARFTPGFSFSSATGRGPNSNRPVVRGLTTIRNGIANSTVAATFVDGVYLGGSSQSTPLYDLERVEILRGPQSAEFGRATYAGAINYITRNPGTKLAGSVELTGAEHETRRVNGWLGGPLAGKWLLFLLSAGVDEYGGEYRNTRDGSTVGGESSRDVALKLQAKPAAALDITWRIALQTTDDDHFASWLQPRTVNNCCFRAADAPRAREYYRGTALTSDTVTLYTDALEKAGGAGTRLDRTLSTLSINWQITGDWTVSSLTGGVRDQIQRGFDSSFAAYDPLPFLPGSFLQRDQLEQRDFSQEIRLTSPRDGAWRWTGGVYYYRGSLDELVENRVIVAPDGSITVAPNFGDLARQEVGNRALFGSVETDLPHELVAGFELRYAADEVRVGSVPNEPGAASGPVYNATFRGISPRFTMTWQANPELMPYLNVARGQSPGTFNADVPDNATGMPDERYRNVDEEVVWSYELGLRGELDRIATRYALATYYLDVRDQQTTGIIELPSGGAATILDNIGRTSVWGLEFESSSQLTDRLWTAMSYAWTHSRIRSQFSEEQADLRGGNGTPADLETLGNVAGNTTPRVPEHMAAVEVQYRQMLGDRLAAYIGGDWSLESSRYAQEANLIETGTRSLLGLQAGLVWHDLDLKLWVRNLRDDDTPVDVQRYFDRRSGILPSCSGYVTAGTAPPGTICAGSSTSPRAFAISLPRGRQFGATLRYRF
ncbi:MAG: TonB-dependent receptor [Gammaproteobacteria bacterium]